MKAGDVIRVHAKLLWEKECEEVLVFPERCHRSTMDNYVLCRTSSSSFGDQTILNRKMFEAFVQTQENANRLREARYLRLLLMQNSSTNLM